MKYASIINQPISQTKPATREQIKNNAGGYVFKLDKWKRLERFLILGSDAPTYYADAKDLTVENARCVGDCLAEDHIKTVDLIVDVSTKGRSFNNDAAIFALAIVVESGNHLARHYALRLMPLVARTASHLFAFQAATEALKGKWNRSRRNAVASWYNSKNPSELAYQMLKYRNRNGWSHKDLLRQSHITPIDNEHSALFDWVVNGKQGENLPSLVDGFLKAQSADNEIDILDTIGNYKLTWEFIPDKWLSSKNVWDALLDNLPMTAMIRNLGKMTSIGLLGPNSATAAHVVDRLSDQTACKKARLHPLNLLVSWKTYNQGHGFKGGLSWKVNPQISDALEGAFYGSFGYTEPTGKRVLWAQDVSGSMSAQMSGKPISCCEAGAAMALTFAKTEKQFLSMGFSSNFVDLKIGKHTSLEEATRKAQMANFGRTDCAVPMLWAKQNKINVDTFIVCTDNETYAGYTHPFKALEEYRQWSGINARLIVVGMTATGFSIANPDDAGMLDVAGFDTGIHDVVRGFATGAF